MTVGRIVRAFGKIDLSAGTHETGRPVVVLRAHQGEAEIFVAFDRNELAILIDGVREAMVLAETLRVPAPRPWSDGAS